VWAGIFAAAALVALAGLKLSGKGKESETSKRVGFYLSFAINFVAAMVCAHQKCRSVPPGHLSAAPNFEHFEWAPKATVAAPGPARLCSRY
jgi:hypothetical protein